MSEREEAEATETAPAHTEVRAEFGRQHLAIVVALGAVAIALGTILGLTLAA